MINFILKNLVKLILFLLMISSSEYLLAQTAGFNTTNPTATVHIVPLSGFEPLRVEGFVSFQNNDSTVLVVDPTSGEVRYMSYPELSQRITVDSSQVIRIMINNADSLLTNQNFVVNLYNTIKDSLLNDTNYLNTLRDSIETLTIISNTDSTILYQDEDGNTTTINVKAMVDSNETVTSFGLTGDSIYYVDENGDTSKIFNDSNILTNFGLIGDSLYYVNENGDTSKIFNDSNILTYFGAQDDSTLWFVDENLDTTKIVFGTDVDSVILQGDTALVIYEGSKVITADLSALKDSSEWIDGAKIGLTPGSIYARKALANGDTVVIDANGNMGIGKEISSYKLEVDGITRVNGNFEIYSNTGDRLFTIHQTTNPGDIYMRAIDANAANQLKNSPKINLRGKYWNGTNSVTNSASIEQEVTNNAPFESNLALKNGSASLNIINNGNTGIGTPNPTKELDVNGEARIQTINDTANVAGVLTSNAAGVVQNLPIDSLAAQLADSSEWIDGAKVGLTPGAIYARKALVNRDTVVIDTSGNLGIGIGKPLVKLEIYDSINSRAHFSSSRKQITNIVTDKLNEIKFRSNNLTDWSIRTSANVAGYDSTNFEISNFIQNRPSSTVPFVINGLTSYVGIGTTAPTHKLDLNGEARIRTIIDTANVAGVLTSNAAGVVQNLPIDSLQSQLADSSEWIDGAKVGLTPGAIYARKALANGDTVVIDTNGNFNTGNNNNIELRHKTNYPYVRVTQHSDIGHPYLNMYKTGGTKLSPTETKAGTQGGLIQHGLTPDLTKRETGRILFSAPKDFTNDSILTDIVFMNADTVTGSVTTKERMRILYNGNVGIGTQTPISKLNLSGETTRFPASLIIDTTSFPNSERAALRLGSFELGQDASGIGKKDFFIFDFDNLTHRFNIDTNGFVGIGTITPTKRLDVNGQARIRTITDTTATQNVLITNANGVVKKIHIDSIKGEEDADFFKVGTTSAPTNINDDIYTMGNVGIGTTTPTNRLTIDAGNSTNPVLVLGNSFRHLQTFRNRITTGTDNITGTAYQNNDGATVSTVGQIMYSDNTFNNPFWRKNSLAIAATRSNGTINFFTGAGTSSGIPKMLIDSNGFTGLNITSPTHRLDVNGETRIRTINDVTVTNNLLVANANGVVEKIHIDSIKGEEDADFFKVGTTSAPTNINDSIYTMGNVGIGMSLPQEALNIAGNFQIGDTIFPFSIMESGGLGGPFGYSLLSGGKILNTGAATKQIVKYANPTRPGLSYISMDGETGNTYFGNNNFGNTNRHVVQMDSIIRMTIASSGNVGIGTISPAYKLHVFDTINTQAQILLEGNQNSDFVRMVTNGFDSTNNPMSIAMGVVGANNTLSGNFGTPEQSFIYSSEESRGLNIISTGLTNGVDERIAFYAGKDANSNSDMVIMPSGNVGIGNTNPSRRLDVRGAGAQIVVGNIGQEGRMEFRRSGDGSPTATMGYSAGVYTIYEGSGAGDIRFRQNVGGTGVVSTMHLEGANGNIGIGTTTPTNQLHISGGTNPIRLDGLQQGTVTDSVLVADATGVVRQIANSQLKASSFTTQTNTYTVADGIEVVLADPTAGAFDVNLPSAILFAGRKITVKRIDNSANNVRILSTAGNIEGNAPATGYTMGNLYEKATLLSDGANWWIISQ